MGSHICTRLVNDGDKFHVICEFPLSPPCCVLYSMLVIESFHHHFHSTIASFDNSSRCLGLDNFFTGHKQNVAHLEGKPNFELLEHDVEVRVSSYIVLYPVCCFWHSIPHVRSRKTRMWVVVFCSSFYSLGRNRSLLNTSTRFTTWLVLRLLDTTRSFVNPSTHGLINM